MGCWIRVLKVILTSSVTKKKMIFGENYLKGEDDLEITITGTKYLSSIKDQFTINIYNLTYNEMNDIILGKYYDAEVWCGYRNGSVSKVFKGSVIYVSNDRYELNTNRCIILCGNKYIAQYGQKKMSLSLNSGMNLWDVANFILRRQGLKNYKIDERLKTRYIKEVESINSSPQSWLENFASKNNLLLNVDSTSLKDITILSSYKTNNRYIELKNNDILLVNGYPKITSEGLSLSVLPTFNFMPGDVIKIDNSIINTSVSENNSSYFSNSIFIDMDGRYMIYQVDYELDNMDGDFICNLKTKARSLYGRIRGGDNEQ